MKVSSKQADATLAKLANVMVRNTELATSTPVTTPAAGPVATYAPAAPTAAPRKRPVATPLSAATGIRLTAQDKVRIREVIQAGFDLQETLSTSDVIRLALRAFEPRRLSSADIAAMRAQDGRVIRVAQ